MTADTRTDLAPGSATNDPLQLRAQLLAREPALFLMPALAAVAPARVALGRQAGEAAWTEPLGHEQVAQRLREPTRAIVLFDDHHALLFSDALAQLVRKLVEREHPHVPDLEIVEQGLIVEPVDVSQHRTPSNDAALVA